MHNKTSSSRVPRKKGCSLSKHSKVHPKTAEHIDKTEIGKFDEIELKKSSLNTDEGKKDASTINFNLNLCHGEQKFENVPLETITITNTAIKLEDNSSGNQGNGEMRKEFVDAKQRNGKEKSPIATVKFKWPKKGADEAADADTVSLIELVSQNSVRAKLKEEKSRANERRGTRDGHFEKSLCIWIFLKPGSSVDLSRP